VKSISRLGAAIEYARMGWRVFPLSGKHPLPGTHGHLDATTNKNRIRRWWARYPDANIGIACDSQNGPIVVDVDGPTGMAFIESLSLPVTAEATSRRRDRKHLYFHPNGTAYRRMIKPIPGIALDILGDGGYVVAPPSIHPDTGKTYRWLNDNDTVEFPQALKEVLQKNTKKKQRAAPLPKVLTEGQRDDLLTSLAGSMRRRGASHDAILAALREENDQRCNPPLPDRDLKKIAKSIAKKSPSEKNENHTDLGNARRFIELYGQDVRSVRAWRRPWLVWTGINWEIDSTGEVERLAKHTVRSMYEEAARIGDPDYREALMKHANKSEASTRIDAMLKLASSEPEISVVADLFDHNQWLFNCENGTINLKDGTFRAAAREDLITRVAPVRYRPTAKCPAWRKFLRDITNNSPELMHYLQRAVGYSMTGDVREQCLFFCFGSGQNGKSTFLEVIRELIGPYGQQADFSTFLSRRSGDSPRNDLARMRGIRFVSAVEVASNREFDESVLKQLTGGDTITARRLYEEFFEFPPTHKLWLAANHKPVIADQSEGFWRRIRLIPFTVYIPPKKRDRDLRRKLSEEMPGILNWALDGCRMWLKEGLGEPFVVKQATAEYREEEDLMGEFLGQACVLHRTRWTTTNDLYQGFTSWWRETRGTVNRPPSMRWFTRALGERPELESSKKRRLRGWKGISLRNDFQ